MISPANQKVGLRMSTLHEEQIPLPRKHSLDLITDENPEEMNEDEGTQATVCTLNIIRILCENAIVSC